jgi:heparinase II/III-like protein
MKRGIEVNRVICPFFIIVLTASLAHGAELKGHLVKTLLKRLDLSRPGLEEVKATSSNPAAAAKELLKYYRARKTVKHPIGRSHKAKARGRYASPRSIKVANDAIKHILIACPSYPRHFVGKDIDWDSRPVPDGEWIWQLHRMSSWSALARAYWHTGNEKYAKAWCEQLVDWVRKNPRNRAHKHAWRSIEAGIRGHSWMSHYQHFIDSPHFTPDVLAAFLSSCFDHADYLKDHGNRTSNWALMEAEGLAFIAVMFPEFRDAAKWRRKAFGTFAKQIKLQVRPDGQQIEQCMNYHNGCIRWFTRAPELARLNGYNKELPAAFWKTIERMCEVTMKLSLPGGMSAQFGDTSSQVNCAGALKQWAGVFQRDDFRYVASHGRHGAAPKKTAYALKDSGFYSMRSNWGPKAIAMVLKSGPDGGFHCQPDNGTFELNAFGRRLMPDSGTYIYHGDKAGREWFRQTAVHQTITLDGKNSDYRAKLLLWKPGKDIDAVVVENKSYKGLTHRRAVLFVKKKFFVIIDDAVGAATGDVDLHFQLAPGEIVIDRKEPFVRTGFDDANVLIQALPQPGMRLQKEKGEVSFHYGSREPRPAFRFRIKKTGRAAVRFVTVLVPYKGKVAPDAQVELIGASKPGSKKVELKVAVGKTAVQVGYDLTNGKAWLR